MPETDIEISHALDLSKDLPPEVEEEARKQGEDPDRVCLMVQELRDMIYERGECKPHRMDDDYLIKFLRARFWKVENSYKLLCRYYKFREDNLDLHVDVHPIQLKCIGEDDVVSVTPYRDQNGRRNIYYKVGNWRPGKIPLVELFRGTLVLLEIGSLEPRTQVLGAVGIFDLEGLSLNHAWHMTPSVAQKIISLMVTCMPIKITSIHIVNQNWTFDAIYQIFKSFLSERMKEKLFIHGNDYKSLHQHIDPAHLPEEYGGTMKSFTYQPWFDSLSKNETIIKELEQLGYLFDAEEFEE
uniref:Putative transporter n=1 Tax=Corethrella appendiculata TaxID=1370023 RepID=U5EUI3_9DIPT